MCNVRFYFFMLIEGLLATLYPHQVSGVLSSTCWADGLVEVPVDSVIEKGDKVNYLTV